MARYGTREGKGSIGWLGCKLLADQRLAMRMAMAEEQARRKRREKADNQETDGQGPSFRLAGSLARCYAHGQLMGEVRGLAG